MRHAAYLTLSDQNIYHFRWPIPQQHSFNRKRRYLKLSLGTRDPKEALRLAKALSYVADRLVHNGVLRNMDYIQIKEIVQTYFQRCLQETKERIDWLGIEQSEDAGQIAAARIVSDNLKLVQNLNTYEAGSHNELVAQVCKTMKLNITEKDIEWQYVEQNISNAWPAYAKAYSKMIDDMSNNFEFDVTPNIKPPIPTYQKSQPTFLLGSIINTYVTTHVNDGAWDANTQREKRAILSLLEELLGSNYNISEMNLAKARELRDALKLVPRNRNKNPLVRDMPIREAIKSANAEKISSVTYTKYLNTYRSLFEWCKLEGYTADNPFSKIIGSTDKNKAESPRKAFTPEQATEILGAIMQSKEKHYRYWGSLIGLYSGARLNEVAQLTLDDIQRKDGIWYFHMNDLGDDKRLKTNAAKRLVPIHKKLLELGILAEAERLKQQGHTRFLHELTYCKKNGYGKKLGHYFNQVLLVNLGMKQKELVFHSLRHTAITRLYQAGVEQPIIETIVGHERLGTSQQVYFKEGYKLSQLKEAMDRFDPLAA